MRLTLTSVLFLLVFSLPAQSGGQSMIGKLLEQSEAYYDQAKYDEALDFAEQAIKESRKFNHPELIALVMHYDARARAEVTIAKGSGFNKVLDHINRSNKNSTSLQLKEDNLEILQKISPHLTRDRDMRRLENAVADIAAFRKKVAGMQRDRTYEDPYKMNKDEAIKKYTELLSREKELVSSNEDLLNTNVALTGEVSTLAEVNTTYSGTIEKQQAAIAIMTLEQAQAQLTLEQQKHLLDSLRYTNIIDSLQLAQQDMVLRQTDLELNEAASELKLKESQRNIFLILLGGLLLGGIALFSRYRGISKFSKMLQTKNTEIEIEKQKADDLLLNVLPAAIATELKEKGVAPTKYYELASVLFTDFVNFSGVAKSISPDQLVKDLDHCFRAFDLIIEKHKLEKIKTIGDSYMCAGGLPTKDEKHPHRMIQAAKDIQIFLADWKTTKEELGEPFLEARIGIHTGPVVAGVVGLKKFAYDIWGDTVNIASRLEQTSLPGKINISKTTYDLIKDKVACTHRGTVEVKNMREIDMYFVND